MDDGIESLEAREPEFLSHDSAQHTIGMLYL